MDFIEGLPQSKNSNCILVVVDKLTRYAHFLALKHPFTAHQVAMVFVDNVYKLHSLPSVIVTDRDPIFTSKLWTELFKLTETKLAMSLSRHPQTDGQTEGSTSALRRTSDASCTPAHINGDTGYPSPNSGTTRRTILLLSDPRLKLSTDTHHGILV